MNLRHTLLLLPIVLGACRSGLDAPESADDLRTIDGLSAAGRHEDALIAAEAYRQNHPDDPEGLVQFRRAKAAVMLQQARQACFAEKNLEALEMTREALKIAPDEPVLAHWELKLERKLAQIHAANGDEFFASSSLDAAREEYEKALEYVPGDPAASAGLAQVLLQLNYRRGMGEQYYEDGVHLLRDYWLEQAKTRFAYTNKYLPANDRAKERGSMVASQLAGARCSLAAGMEAQGLWAAARNEYRFALLLAPEHPEAVTGLARTRVEAEAEDKLREVERLTRNKQYDKAREVIEAGLAMTKLQSERFEGAKAGIEEAILENSYQSALALESDQDFEGAIAAYDKLLERRNYYKDALARRDTLRTYVTKAAELYQQVLDSADPADKLRYLRQIELFWPEYRNLPELIRLLKPALTPGEPGNP